MLRAEAVEVDANMEKGHNPAMALGRCEATHCLRAEMQERGVESDETRERLRE